MTDSNTDPHQEEEFQEPGKWGRCAQTAVILLILISFTGTILITFFNQYTGRTTLPPQLPDIAYLNWTDDGTLQLFITTPLRDSPPRQLTQEPGGVSEFTFASNGLALAYVVKMETGGTHIITADWNGRETGETTTVLTCANDTCNRLVWHPDGRRLLYERRALAGGAAQLWWLDTITGETVTLPADETAVSHSAAISPDGKWVSYADPAAERLVLYAFGEGILAEMPHVIGSPAVWHPDSQQLLYSDFDLVTYHSADDTENHQEHAHDFAQAIHLYLTDTAGQHVTLLNDTGNVDDSNAAWSANGEWIAFGRKPIGTAAGRQLWQMRPDGGEARALTNDTATHHGPPAYSPDGRYLLFQRLNLEASDAKPAVWLLEINTGLYTPVTETGILPGWVPKNGR